MAELEVSALLIDELKGLPGVDYDSAIRRLTGNEQLYLRLVDSFLKDGFTARISAAMASRDADVAGREAHAIKGVASNLGFIGISALAGRLCVSLKQRDFEQSEALLVQLEDAFATVQKVLRGI